MPLSPSLPDVTHLSVAKQALLIQRLKGKSGVPEWDEPPAPIRLIRDPALRHVPHRVRPFIAERLRYRREGRGDFRLVIETCKRGLDVDRYADAWRRLYRETEAMRTFVVDDALVVKSADEPYSIVCRDARALSSKCREALLFGTRARFELMDATKGDLAVGIAVIRTDDDEYACFFSFDLLVMDLPSIEFLALRCRRIYQDSYQAKDPVYLQDYRRTEDAYLASRDGQDACRHWQRRIKMTGPRLSASDLTHKSGPEGYAYLCRNLPREVWSEGQRRAKARGLSELAAVRVLFTDLLVALSGRANFAYETRSFQRLPLDPNIYELLGQFTLGHLTQPGARDASFAERVRAEADRMDKDAPFAFFDAASAWQAVERPETRGGKIVFTNTCNRFEDFVLAGNVPPMRWFGDYRSIEQRNPDTALEYVLVENAGDLENHWFLNTAHLPLEWAEPAAARYCDALQRLCVDDAAWDARDLFAAGASA